MFDPAVQAALKARPGRRRTPPRAPRQSGEVPARSGHNWESIWVAQLDGRFSRVVERLKALDGKLNLFGAVTGLALACLGVLARLDRFA